MNTALPTIPPCILQKFLSPGLKALSSAALRLHEWCRQLEIATALDKQ